MPIGTTAPPDLGRLAALDERRLEAGVILWDRFCIVGEPRELDGSRVVTVTDLERKLGEPDEQHRLELHLLRAPPQPAGEARVRRAVAIKSRVQPRAHALGRAGELLVLVCSPARGTPLGLQSPVSGRQLLGLGVELAGLLAELHGADVSQVRFTRAMLRVEHGHVGVDRFTHLLWAGETVTASRAAQRADVDALVELLRGLGEWDPTISLDSSTTAVELREHLAAGLGAGAGERLEFPADPPFVGRARALAELDRGFDQAQIAQPTAILLQGQRGVGKSRLLTEFVAARLRADDAIVLTGAWQEHSADSRGGLSSALEQLTEALARLDPDERDDIRGRINRATRHLGAIVARSAPSLGAVLRHVEELPPLELGEDFSRHTAVIADLLRAIGTPKRPLVLVLDNLEVVDASSAAVIKILAQHRPAHHSVIVMGARTGTGFEPGFEHEAVELAPLSVTELEQLLTGVLPGEVADAPGLSEALWSVSAGLPLVAWTNLRAWVDRGRLSRAVDDRVWRARGELRGDTGGRLGVHEVFGARLASAPDSTRELALRIAVLGVSLGASELRALDHDTDVDVDAAVTDLVHRGLLAWTEHGVRFAHDSIRDLVFESFDSDQHRAAHVYAADLLIRHKAPIAQIAYHRDLALDPSASMETFDKLSRLHAEAGRERLAVYDLERARWHLERALEHSRDPDQRGRAAEGLADVCLLSDDVDTAVSLYTAIIATSEPAHAVAVAAKSVAFLFSKSANTEARQLATMALEVVAEPIPTTPFGKFVGLLGAVVRSWFSTPDLSVDVRDALCRLYSWLTIMCLVDDPFAMLMYTARGHWVSKGLETGAAAMVRAIEASVWAALRRYDTANKIFSAAREIAEKVSDPWAQGWTFHNWAHISLLPSDRYEEGQDMLDDAIAAFRETGDVSISIVSIMFKCLYGRDREPADKVLGWYDEATATARRNGKSVATASLEALNLLILARRGRTDLDERFVALAQQLDGEDMTAADRLIARVYFAYAAYEAKAWTHAVEQVRVAQHDLGDLRGIPDYCAEIHLVTALVMLERPAALTRRDRKLLRQATRKCRGAAKHSPRLRPLGALLDIELSLRAGDRAKAQVIASQTVAEFDQHQNLYAARRAHLVLSHLLKGENVLAAAEHDRVARNLGRRLGLQDRALVSDFSEIGDETGMLGLSVDSSIKFDDSQFDIPAAGMLGSTAQPARPAAKSVDTPTDVLEAWALTSTTTRRTIIRDILGPVREAVDAASGGQMLEVHCPNPKLAVAVPSGDLQLVLMNLLLTCRDAAGSNAIVKLRLEPETIVEEAPVGMGEPAPLRSGHYLSICVTAPSPTDRVPILNGFSACEQLVHAVGGHLRAHADRKRISLVAHFALEPAVGLVGSQVAQARVVIIHADSDVRDRIAAALTELGIESSAHEPIEFDVSRLENSAMLFVDGDSLESLVLFEPMLNLRLIEIVKSGGDPTIENFLRFPFELSELEAKVRGS